MNLTQENLNAIWDKLKNGEKFDWGMPPKIDIDDEAEQVMTVPFPEPKCGGITVGRKDKNSAWVLK